MDGSMISIPNRAVVRQLGIEGSKSTLTLKLLEGRNCEEES